MQEHDKILRQAAQRLARETQAGADFGPSAHWLLDNYGYLQEQARELREALSPKFWKKLRPKTIYHVAQGYVADTNGRVDLAELKVFFQTYQQKTPLTIAELWAIRPVFKLALLEAIAQAATQLPRHGDLIPNAITSMRTLDRRPMNDFVESISAVESVLRKDPSGVYPNMDFDTRDTYRRALEDAAERSWHDEVEVARIAIGLAKNAQGADEDPRKAHVGYYLVGPGRKDLRIIAGHGFTLGELLRDGVLAFPNFFYIGGAILLTLALLWAAARILNPVPWWILALLVIPLSQAALAILNLLVNLALPPRRIPRLDFSDGIPDHRRTFLVVPTLLLSRSGVEHLLEHIEIHYLANRDRNLLFGLLTDFPDASSERTDKDDLVDHCAAGIEQLNERYGSSGRRPFYLFHRSRIWNPCEGVWMGHERKRGKLEDFNRFILGEADAFSVKVGDLDAIHDIRYIITLDTDTHLPRDTAREFVATMAHPLNQPILDSHNIVRQGYGLLQPRVSVSMESARRSRLAAIYSGQTGLDPYTKAVSDLYQDLHGQATYTGKGIYDVAAFHRATKDRFPPNTLLSHDLIEGEHVRVGLVTDLEVVDDFPTTYEAYSKRKHRWVRGDWQIAMWLLPMVPNANWHWFLNPLPLLSRWKILDNLRRSLYEISLVLFFIAGMFTTGRALFFTLVGAAVLMIAPAARAIFSLLRFPPRRFLRSFLREVSWNFVQGSLEAAVTMMFALHQALLMTDAIVRTLVRRAITKRKLLEWESMAQAESVGGSKMSLVSLYTMLCPAVATMIAFFAGRAQTGFELLPILVLLLWATTPLDSEFLSRRLLFARGRNPKDIRFLRDIALQTWHYFVDYRREDENWLVPDNVQFNPDAIATRSSPTNMGLQLVADVASWDLGYLTLPELATRLDQVFSTLHRLERMRGHFYNWYDTRTLEPLHPRYISTVDSGNLAAALITVKQACIEASECPIIGRQTLNGLRDHCNLIGDSLPHSSRTAQVMQKIAAICKQLEYEPSDVFSWAGLLRELERMGAELKEHLDWSCAHARLRRRESCEDARYWLSAFNQRLQAMLHVLNAMTPWVNGTLGRDLRIAAADPRMQSLSQLLSPIPKLNRIESHYQAIGNEVMARLASPDTNAAACEMLHDLLDAMESARGHAHQSNGIFRNAADEADRLMHAMDFRFLLDRGWNLMHIGYAVEDGKLDGAHYDLLASEARTAVFIAIAKGDVPREAWFRLGRKLTTYGGYRTLLSWSGTMFEYLMPVLFLRNLEDTLLATSAQGAVRIQQSYCRSRGVPWGISEAAHSARDACENYQYRAFGVPVLGLSRISPDDLVIAPYASVLALMVDPDAAARNLRQMFDRGWRGRYGFYESIDFTRRNPVLINAYMVHHQGMSLLALANSLLENSIQRRFRAEPMVLATELLVQERLPALIEETAVQEQLTLEPVAPPVAIETEMKPQSALSNGT